MISLMFLIKFARRSGLGLTIAQWLKKSSTLSLNSVKSGPIPILNPLERDRMLVGMVPLGIVGHKSGIVM